MSLVSFVTTTPPGTWAPAHFDPAWIPQIAHIYREVTRGARLLTQDRRFARRVSRQTGLKFHIVAARPRLYRIAYRQEPPCAAVRT